jgi:hypothetical protein
MTAFCYLVRSSARDELWSGVRWIRPKNRTTSSGREKRALCSCDTPPRIEKKFLSGVRNRNSFILAALRCRSATASAALNIPCDRNKIEMRPRNRPRRSQSAGENPKYTDTYNAAHNEKPAETAGLRQTLPLQENLERAKGFEPSTPTLARSCSTTELHPHPRDWRRLIAGNGQSYAKCGFRMQQPVQGLKSTE